ncbi:MAG: hypothetical protein M3O94_07875 [Actinomycetota bacterium]|nr:hypothetical protein [Actinomycetota bacterium]
MSHWEAAFRFPRRIATAMPGCLPPWLPGIALSPGYLAGSEPRVNGHDVDGAEPLRCSARGCVNAAEYALRWNNPKIHAADRRKTWLACADHRQSLTDFLDARGFFREAEPLQPGENGGPG